MAQSSTVSSWFGRMLEPTPSHYTYLVLSTFLLLFALFSSFIRNNLHLSEPPLATLFGIIFGPRGIGVLDPTSWGLEDNITQEATRIVVGLQVFTVGIDLPKRYFSRHWSSVAILIGPVMAFSWISTALCVRWVLQTDMTTAMIVSACLAPTDPVLAAAVLAESKFSHRVPKRIRHLLSAESGCNDGTSFPFLYIGLCLVLETSKAAAAKEWFLATVLWQCLLGLTIGLIIGTLSNKLLRVVEHFNYIDHAAFLVFYILLAILSVGVGSILGVDDFLVAFGAGYGFAWDGWFRAKMRETHLPSVLDMLLNSTMFVYFGAIIPWHQFSSTSFTPEITVLRLFALLALVLLFRRMPIILLLYRVIPDIKTVREALFCGHFGPMGLGALFLVIEARAQLETGTSLPTPHPPAHSPRKQAIETIWPVVCFIVLGSTMIHGFSVPVVSLAGHFMRHRNDRAALVAGETDQLHGMIHDNEPARDLPSSDDDGTDSGEDGQIQIGHDQA